MKKSRRGPNVRPSWAVLIALIAFAIWVAKTYAAEGTVPAPVSFDEARKQMLDRLPELAQADSDRRAARLRALPLIYSALPKLSFSAQQQWVGGQNLPDQVNESFAGAQLSFNLFRGGADAYSFTQGREIQHRADADYQAALLKLENQVAHELVDVVAATEAHDIAKLRVDATQEAYNVARARFGRGLSPDQDVERLAIEYDQAVAELADSEISFAQLRNGLKARLGDVELEGRWPWIEMFRSDEFRKMLERPTPALDSLPAYQSANWALEAAESAKNVQRGALLPSLDLSAEYGWAGTQVFDSNPRAWQTGVTLSVPILDRLQTSSAYRASLADAASARSRLAVESRDRQLDLDNSIAALRLAHSSALSRAKLVDRSFAFYKKSLNLLKLGRISTSDLLLDEDRWLQARGLASQGWAHVHAAWIDTCAARGRSLDKCRD